MALKDAPLMFPSESAADPAVARITQSPYDRQQMAREFLAASATYGGPTTGGVSMRVVSFTP